LGLIETPLRAEVRITAPTGEIMENHAALTARGEVIIHVPINDPQRWWPTATANSRSIKLKLPC
jgi:hypothetical protein